MTKWIYEDFDGYDQLLAEREFARKYAHDFIPQKDAPDQYIERLHPRRLSVRVMEIRDLTPSTKLFRLASLEGYLPPFQAGQYIPLHVSVDRIRTSRPYSICSSPGLTDYYDIAVRRVPGGLVSNYLLDEIGRNDEMEISGPTGLFYHNPLFHDSNRVMIAGGSGITPLYSMISDMITKRPNGKVHLFYGNRTLEEAVFHQELLDISGKHEFIHYYPVIENPPSGYDGLKGLITGELIKNIVGEVAKYTYYLCGPQGMYDFCLPELETIGVPHRKIRRELYGPPLNVCLSPGWPERISPDQRFVVKVEGGGGFEVLSRESLLSALEKNGHVVPSECRSGECSMCRVKILSGEVFQPAGALVRRSDQHYGYVHSCVSYPLSDLEIVL